jgi:hypothetical protein
MTSATTASVSASGANPTPALPSATFDVSPAQVQVGGLTLSLAFEPARHMGAETATSAPDPDPAHASGASAPPAATASSSVLDGMLQLTNNIDPSQPAPADAPQAMMRHVRVEVQSSDGGNPIPYLSASLDMLLDGRPIMSNLAVVPMVATEATTPQFYYGNNVKLAQPGTYQVFVRLQPSALLGKETPQAAQFNVVVH